MATLSSSDSVDEPTVTSSAAASVPPAAGPAAPAVAPADTSATATSKEESDAFVVVGFHHHDHHQDGDVQQPGQSMYDNEIISLSTSTNDSSTIPSPENHFYVSGGNVTSSSSSTNNSRTTPTVCQSSSTAPAITAATSPAAASPCPPPSVVMGGTTPLQLRTATTAAAEAAAGSASSGRDNDDDENPTPLESSSSFGMDLDSSDGSNDAEDNVAMAAAVAAAVAATVSSTSTTTTTTATPSMAGHDLPDEFHRSPEPLSPSPAMKRTTAGATAASNCVVQLEQEQHPQRERETSSGSSDSSHNYHMLSQIHEDRESSGTRKIDGDDDDDNSTDRRGGSTLPPATGRASSPVRSPIGSPLRRTSGFSNANAHHSSSLSDSPHSSQVKSQQERQFEPQYACTKIAYWISKRVFQQEEFAVATWMGFWALLNVTCANYVLSPMRDAVALQVGVQHIPKLTLASSLLAFLSSVPIGWLFEAPDPSRRKVWKKMGLTRGETQGTSLALFYRVFAVLVLSYAVGFQLVDLVQNGKLDWMLPTGWFNSTAETSARGDEDDVDNTAEDHNAASALFVALWRSIPYWLTQFGSFMSVTFFLVIHLMKLHSISLVWGVTTEAMEYEDVARKQLDGRHVDSTGSFSSLQHQHINNSTADVNGAATNSKKRTRLQRLGLVSFGGTLGGVWGSFLASSMAKYLGMSGLLILSAYLLEVSAELSIELGRVMQKHWQEQQIFQSTQDLTSLDPSMKRSASVGSMKRVASGNSLYVAQQQNMKRVASGNSIARSTSSSKSLVDLGSQTQQNASTDDTVTPMAKGVTPSTGASAMEPPADDNTFTQRLLRGITTILKSRLLMAVFTYNALFASTSVLLSFQRAALVANRNKEGTTVSADTAFLANINMASSIAVFAMQASGIGAVVAQRCGSRGSLALMPLIRLLCIGGLCWWHRWTDGQPPNLILFLMLDECTRVINLAVAKPVRESLWRGLSNEARYEAKPIVDTLANRWGAGSASFCVSVVSRVLLILGQKDRRAPNGDPIVLGLPPVLFLGFIVAAWWLGVSLDLGQIRRRIDMELKKRQ